MIYLLGLGISTAALAACSKFLQPEELQPGTILVDEPELGLHPYAINVC
ncbi:MAG: hypothetical protein RMY34_27525 [Aulosira sp. DedQUE10]|nr:hypothetical protein [Aulosira sp. DedQUE10]